MVKGTIEQEQGKQGKKPALVNRGKMTVTAAMKILADIEAEANKNVPKVILPGGVTLSHALACVEVCRRMAEGKRSNS